MTFVSTQMEYVTSMEKSGLWRSGALRGGGKGFKIKLATPVGTLRSQLAQIYSRIKILCKIPSLRVLPLSGAVMLW